MQKKKTGKERFSCVCLRRLPPEGHASFKLGLRANALWSFPDQASVAVRRRMRFVRVSRLRAAPIRRSCCREFFLRALRRSRVPGSCGMAMTAKTDDQAAAPSEAPEKDSPLLDLSDAAVKKFIKTAKARGYVTLDELNAVLPSEEVSPDQIEDTMSMLSDMGITVVESEDPDEAAAPQDVGGAAEEEEPRAAPSPSRPPACRPSQGPRRADRAHRRSRAHVPARHGLGGAAVARGRDRHRQAHRGRPRGDDRGPVRKPADLPGRHHLARRAERRQDPAARHHRSGGHLRGPRGQGRPAGADRSAPVDAPPPPPRLPATAPKAATASRAPRARWTTTRTSRTRCRSPPWKPS